MKVDSPCVVPPTGGAVHYVLGAPYRFLTTSDVTNGAFSLIEVNAAPGSGVPLHRHTREDETFFVLEGKVEVQCDGLAVVLEKDGTAFLPRNIPHSYRNPGNEPARYLVLITPGGFEKYLEELAALPKNQPPAMEMLAAMGKRYGLEFPAP